MQHQALGGTRARLSASERNEPIHSHLTPQIFIESAVSWAPCWGRDIEPNTKEQNRVLVFMGFMICCSINWGRGRQQLRKQTSKITGGNDKGHKGNKQGT